MKILRLAGGALLVIAVAGCALQTLQYVEPADSETAELSISTNAPLSLIFYRDANRCTDALQVAAPTNGLKSYRIPGNKEFAMRFFYIEGGVTFSISCPEEIVSFQAMSAAHYHLNYSLNRADRTCHWRLTEDRGVGEVPVTAYERERDPDLTSIRGEGTWCKART